MLMENVFVHTILLYANENDNFEEKFKLTQKSSKPSRQPFTLQLPQSFFAVRSTYLSTHQIYSTRRHDRDGDDVELDVPYQEPKRRLTFATVVREVMRGLSLKEFATMCEPLLRRVVREEVERIMLCQPSPKPLVDQFDLPRARSWQLHFEGKLPSTLFTGNRIESENNTPLKIVVIDAISKKILTLESPSAIKVEIVVLDGDFGADDWNDWTENEYSANIVRQREGKRPLLAGEVTFTLRIGVGYITDVSFTDNSSWIRSRRFRLGARVVQSISTEVSIREARSEAFVVKDHRGVSYKKHHPPNLGDEVWRLERIAKDGVMHKRLADKGITTVKDFLQLYYVDSSSLHNILGGGISSKTWETIIEHATTCVPDDKFYIYYGDNIGLVLNSMFKVVAVTFDGQNYQSLDKLDMLQMGLVENLKRLAHKNLNGLVPLDEPLLFGPAMLSSGLLSVPFSSPSLQHANSSGVLQGTAGDAAPHFQSHGFITI